MNMFNDKRWLTATIFLIALIIICQLDELIYQIKKSRVMLFHTETDSNVINGDFRELPFPSAEQRVKMRENNFEKNAD